MKSNIIGNLEDKITGNSIKSKKIRLIKTSSYFYTYQLFTRNVLPVQIANIHCIESENFSKTI